MTSSQTQSIANDAPTQVLCANAKKEIVINVGQTTIVPTQNKTNVKSAQTNSAKSEKKNPV